MDKYLQELKKGLEIVMNKFKQELRQIRGNRPSAQLIENLKVNYYDQSLAIKQLGALSVIPPQEINISVWDKNVIPAIIKAIETVNLGLSVKNEGNLVRVFLPSLTEERKQELLKLVGRLAEETKIRLRSLRDEINKKIKAGEESGELSEDVKFKAKEEVQKIIGNGNQEIEKLAENKSEEITV